MGNGTTGHQDGSVAFFSIEAECEASGSVVSMYLILHVIAIARSLVFFGLDNGLHDFFELLDGHATDPRQAVRQLLLFEFCACVGLDVLHGTSPALGIYRAEGLCAARRGDGSSDSFDDRHTRLEVRYTDVCFFARQHVAADADSAVLFVTFVHDARHGVTVLIEGECAYGVCFVFH